MFTKRTERALERFSCRLVILDEEVCVMAERVLKIARRFSAGLAAESRRVPAGTLERVC